MQGRYKLKIGDSVKDLWFNNFAHVELSKAMFESGHYVSSPDELINRMLEMSTTNVALFMKAIVYAGIIGHDYEVGFKATMTQEEVGALISNINKEDLLGVWDVFLEAMGVNLKDLVSRKEVEEETEEEEEKKT